MVSDLRLTCVYKDASPNIKTPRTIKVLDTDFTVLESAWSSCAEFKPGDTVTLLLTADGNVAGMAATNKARSTAIGMVDSGGVNIYRPDGGILNLKGELSKSAVTDQLVTVSATKTNISASRLSSRAAPGAFDVGGMKLGSYTVTAGVRVYEQVSGGAMVAVDRGDLGTGSIAAGRVASYHLNTSNMVDYIVLSDVTGDAYEYGMMVAVTTTEKTGGDAIIDEATGEQKVENGKPQFTPVVDVTTTSWKLVRREGQEIEFVSSMGYSGRSGDMVGVVPGTPMGDGDGKTIKAIVQLTEIKNVKPGDFFDSQGVPHVTANGRTYRVADSVECCRNISGNWNDSGNWLTQGTGAQRLAAIKAYSDNLTIYVDPVGQQVRIIKAN